VHERVATSEKYCAQICTHLRTISGRLARDTQPAGELSLGLGKQPLHPASLRGLHGLFEICDRLTRLATLLEDPREHHRQLGFLDAAVASLRLGHAAFANCSASSG
jgi:hypothetical protein